MNPADDRRRERDALDWAQRVQDPHFADWEGHLDWLEADPGNAEAFDAAMLLIERATEGLAPAPARPPVDEASNDNLAVPPATRYGRWLAMGAGLAAAAIVGLVSLPHMMPGAGQAYAIETAPGEQRAIMLRDGTRVALNGGTLIRLDRVDPRSVSIDRGEAFFTVVHDATHPFAVKAGAATFQDVGTAFDVIRSDEATEMSVREGAVMYDPEGAAVRLGGGQSIAVARDGASVRQIDAGAVGLWQRGRLSYDDASLATVARDIARSIGRPVSVDRALGERHFTGVIVIEADRARMFRRVAAITGVSIRPDGAGWRMASPTR